MRPLLETLRTLWFEHWVTWAIFVAYLTATWVAAGLVRRVVRTVAARITARTDTTLDDRIAKALVGPVRFFVLVGGISLSLRALGNRIPSFGNPAALGTEFVWVTRIVSALVILAVARVINALLNAAMDWYLEDLSAGNSGIRDRGIITVIRRVLSVLVYFIAASIILKNHFHQDITALVTTAGVASLAVALAAQDTLSNMLGGFVILADRPFKLGDTIELPDGKAGDVVEIGLRSTRIRQFDGTTLVVPNQDMANSQVVNYALPTRQAAIRQTIGVGYDTDLEKAKRLLLEIMESHPEVLKDPKPGVWFTNFGASSLDLFMSCWVESYSDRFRIADELNMKILKVFREENISIPYPQQDVHLYVQRGSLENGDGN